MLINGNLKKLMSDEFKYGGVFVKEAD